MKKGYFLVGGMGIFGLFGIVGLFGETGFFGRIGKYGSVGVWKYESVGIFGNRRFTLQCESSDENDSRFSILESGFDD